MRYWKSLGLLAVLSLLPGFAVAAEPTIVQPSPWMILPFVFILIGIAIIPFISKHWWERWYPAFVCGLGMISVGYYLFVLNNPVRMLISGLEYVSFIALIGSLFVVAGGIHIRIKGKSTPLRNVFFLMFGAIVANILGTTGASMILIRPFIRVNRYRIRPYHIVFFIFIVSNMGGALTPIGDPPLFLGYLKGIPFFWVAEHLWTKWAIGVALVIGIFYILDRRSFLKLPLDRRHGVEGIEEEGEASGIHNIVFLTIILVAVFINNPPFLREALMIFAAIGSYFTTKDDIHKKNEFSFGPVKEVAILFLGIFATMVPALDWLELNATSLGLQSAGQFYWATGSLSAFLDNAPTYLNFLSACFGLFLNNDVVQQVQAAITLHGSAVVTAAGAHGEEVRATVAVLAKYHGDLIAAGAVPLDDIATAYIMGNHMIYLQAISLAAVFFGACSYIGNGPNFMVKSIAENSGVQTPSFFGYIGRYTLPVLLPVFLLIWVLFFR
jgi:Na+/H+ antiporter NhaD/arsenite permease-like protein